MHSVELHGTQIDSQLGVASSAVFGPQRHCYWFILYCSAMLWEARKRKPAFFYPIQCVHMHEMKELHVYRCPVFWDSDSLFPLVEIEIMQDELKLNKKNKDFR